MQRLHIVLALLVAATPATGLAQTAPGPGMPAPSAQMIQAHAAAKTAAYNDLSADHRAKVQSIADRFNSGAIGRDDAISQIDAILTPAEKQAVLEEARKVHEQMRKDHPDGTMGPGGPPPAGAPPRPMHGPPDAGHFLLAVSATPERLHDAMGMPPH